MTAEIRELIGRQLQRVYGAVVNDPLPIKLSKLLEQLQESSAARRRGEAERES